LYIVDNQSLFWTLFRTLSDFFTFPAFCLFAETIYGKGFPGEPTAGFEPAAFSLRMNTLHFYNIVAIALKAFAGVAFGGHV